MNGYTGALLAMQFGNGEACQCSGELETYDGFSTAIIPWNVALDSSIYLHELQRI